MNLKHLRIKLAHFIAPEIREGHVAEMDSVKNHCEKVLKAQYTIVENFNRAVNRANDQAEGLYAETYPLMPDKMREKWVAMIGLPNPAAIPNEFGGVKVVELRDFGEL